MSKTEAHDWHKIYNLVHIARTAQDFPQLHWLRDEAIEELNKNKPEEAAAAPPPEAPPAPAPAEDVVKPTGRFSTNGDSHNG